MTRPAIHPGVHIANELEALQMPAAALARELGIPANRLTEIIRGRRGITADTALRLARWLGTLPQLWMNLQKTTNCIWPSTSTARKSNAPSNLARLPDNQVRANRSDQPRGSGPVIQRPSL